MMVDGQKTELILAAQSTDPVIQAKRRKLELIETYARRFPRIDIKFLAIPEKRDDGVTPDKPAFAILPLAEYVKPNQCTYSGGRYTWSGGPPSGGVFDVVRMPSDFHSSAMAMPPSEPTDEAVAIANEVQGDFDRIMVAWEADWNVAAADPLMIGEIDGIWFLLAKWDLSRLESFISTPSLL